jgi:geranylgeranyl pyrophosphate synthase
VHVAFGEAVALLTALALLNRGYELFLSPVAGAPAEGGARVLRAATRAIGSDGMIGGQALDLGLPAGTSLASRDRKTTTLARHTSPRFSPRSARPPGTRDTATGARRRQSIR